MVNYKNFNATVYTGDIRAGFNGKVTYHSQHNLERFKIMVASKYPQWVRMNLYDKKTNECETLLNTERESKSI